MTTQRTPEWLAERREGITSTDIPVILGLSPYKSEAALAREKAGDESEHDEATLRRFRFGLALEAVIRDEDELEHGIRLRRVNRLLRHREIPWAMTSLDFERVGERTIVEAKSTASRRWDEGVPADVEAQVRWQMGVARYPRAHVAVLRSGSELACYDLEHDPALFDGLVAVAADFRRRLAEGGPFAESLASIRARWPSDDGSEMAADAETAEAVRDLLATRAVIDELEAKEEALKVAIQTRMGEASLLVGDGWHAVWRRTRDREEVDWKGVAAGLLAAMPETERTALVGLHTSVRPGFRPFRLVTDKESTR